MARKSWCRYCEGDPHIGEYKYDCPTWARDMAAKARMSGSFKPLGDAGKRMTWSARVHYIPLDAPIPDPAQAQKVADYFRWAAR